MSVFQPGQKWGHCVKLALVATAGSQHCACGNVHSIPPQPSPSTLALTVMLAVVFQRTLQTQASVGRLVGPRRLLRHSNPGRVTPLIISFLLICSVLSSVPGNTWSLCITWRGLPFTSLHLSLFLTPLPTTSNSTV